MAMVFLTWEEILKIVTNQHYGSGYFNWIIRGVGDYQKAGVSCRRQLELSLLDG